MPPKFVNSEVLPATRSTDVAQAVAVPLRRLWALWSTWCGRAAQRRALGRHPQGAGGAAVRAAGPERRLAGAVARSAGHAAGIRRDPGPRRPGGALRRPPVAGPHLRAKYVLSLGVSGAAMPLVAWLHLAEAAREPLDMARRTGVNFARRLQGRYSCPTNLTSCGIGS